MSQSGQSGLTDYMGSIPCFRSLFLYKKMREKKGEKKVISAHRHLTFASALLSLQKL